MSRTPLASLELLIAIGDHGSISGAARALGVAQPTVSAALRVLERSLGLRLVDRSPQGSALTPQGVTIATWAREVVAASDTFEASVANLRGGGRTRLIVAASMTIAEHLMPAGLARLRRSETAASDGIGARSTTGTGLAVELLVRNSEDVMRSVQDGSAHVGFVEGCDALPGLRESTVGQDELVVVVGASHPWANRTEPITPADLARASLVLREKGSGTRDVFDRAMRAAGYPLDSDLPSVGSTAAIRSAVVEGELVAVLSQLAVRTEVQLGTLIKVPVTGLDLRRDFRVVTRSAPGPAVQRLIAALAQVRR